jgi:Tfp pilus assembly protein FimV
MMARISNLALEQLKTSAGTMKIKLQEVYDKINELEKERDSHVDKLNKQINKERKRIARDEKELEEYNHAIATLEEALNANVEPTPEAPAPEENPDNITVTDPNEPAPEGN